MHARVIVDAGSLVLCTLVEVSRLFLLGSTRVARGSRSIVVVGASIVVGVIVASIRVGICGRTIGVRRERYQGINSTTCSCRYLQWYEVPVDELVPPGVLYEFPWLLVPDGMVVE